MSKLTLVTRALSERPSRMPMIHCRYLSVCPAKQPRSSSSSSPTPKKTTITHLNSLFASKTPITMLTAYDYSTARACSAHTVDLVLVGDSLAQVCLGYPSTTCLTLDEMLHHCRAVARGITTPLIIGDLPFGTYATGTTDAIHSAVRLVKEGRVESVKLEGAEDVLPQVRAISQVGIPVMAHIGLMPQRHVSLSGYRVQGRTADSARSLMRAARTLQDAGAFAMVLEAMPSVLGAYITEQLNIPTIGVGAGPGTSGQALVFDDITGNWSGQKPKFVRHFADVRNEVARGVSNYVVAVKAETFPNFEREGYTMDREEWETFLTAEGKPSWIWTPKAETASIQKTVADDPRHQPMQLSLSSQSSGKENTRLTTPEVPANVTSHQPTQDTRVEDGYLCDGKI